MDNATLKFGLVAGLALAVIYFMTRRNERFEPLNETDTSRYEHNARYTPSGPKKSSLVRACVGKTRPTGTGASVNLLPKPAADKGFAQFAPDPDALTGQNFVDASRWVSLGAMTTKRNISRDLRADIPIPKNNGISPWSQSSIEQQRPNKPLDC